MFPPKPTEEITKCLENMLSSLCRAGLEVVGDIGLDPIEDEKYSVMIRVQSPVPEKAWPPMRAFIKEYASISGWDIEKIRQVRGAVLLIASRA